MSLRPEVSTVLCTFSWKPEEIDQLRRAFAPAEFVVCKPSDKATVTDTLRRAQVALLGTNLSQDDLGAHRVKWAHCDLAGLNGAAKPETFAKGLIVSGSAGRSGPRPVCGRVSPPFLPGHQAEVLSPKSGRPVSHRGFLCAVGCQSCSLGGLGSEGTDADVDVLRWSENQRS
jgi:hypothetical protein